MAPVRRVLDPCRESFIPYPHTAEQGNRCPVIIPAGHGSPRHGWMTKTGRTVWEILQRAHRN
jgi:hypothetical protein